MRDPCGIRPAFYYRDDEVVVAASERAVIQTAFNKSRTKQVRELDAGPCADRPPRRGRVSVEPFTAPQPIRPCSFERIYFSRGSDQRHLPRTQAAGRAARAANPAQHRPRHRKYGFFLYSRIRPRAPFSDWSKDWTTIAARISRVPKESWHETRHADRSSGCKEILRYKPRIEKDGDQGCQDADVHHAGQRTRRPGGPRLRHHLRHHPRRMRTTS